MVQKTRSATSTSRSCPTVRRSGQSVPACGRRQRAQTSRSSCSATWSTSRARSSRSTRILSLDVDATDWADVGRRDPVIGALQAARPGFRPVNFVSPYEAACWLLLTQRSSRARATVVRDRIAADARHRRGHPRRRASVLPRPRRAARPCAPATGCQRLAAARLRAVAEAALDGDLLDGQRLRAGRSRAGGRAAHRRRSRASGRSPRRASSCAAPVRRTCWRRPSRASPHACSAPTASSGCPTPRRWPGWPNRGVRSARGRRCCCAPPIEPAPPQVQPGGGGSLRS